MVEKVTNRVSRNTAGLHSLQSLGWGAVAMQQLSQLINWSGENAFQATPVSPWAALVAEGNSTAIPDITASSSSPEPVVDQAPNEHQREAERLAQAQAEIASKEAEARELTERQAAENAAKLAQEKLNQERQASELAAAEQAKAEQAKAEQAKAEQAKAEQAKQNKQSRTS